MKEPLSGNRTRGPVMEATGSFGW